MGYAVRTLHFFRGWGREIEGGGRGTYEKPLTPSLKFSYLPSSSYSALERPEPTLVSLIMAWAAAMRAMGMRMGEQDT